MHENIHHTRSATFWRIFVNYAVPALLLMIGVFLLFYVDELRSMREETRRNNQSAADAMTDSMEDILSERLIEAEQMNSLYWIQRQFLPENVLEEMSPLEIYRQTENTLLRTNAYTMETRIFLMFPGRDICFSYHTWASTADYMAMLDMEKEQGMAFAEQVAGENRMKLIDVPEGSKLADSLVLSLPLEKTKKPRGYVIYALDKTRLVALLETQMAGSVNGMRVLDADGEEVFSFGEWNGQSGVLARQSRHMGWRYEFSVAPGVYAGSGSSMRMSVLLFASVLLIALAVFYVTALRIYQPIGRLVSTVTGGGTSDARQDDYQIIGQSFSQLRMQVRYERRFATLQSLLLGYFNEAEGVDERGDLLFRNEMYFQVMRIREHTRANTLAALEEMAGVLNGYRSVVSERIDLENKPLLILGYENEAVGVSISGKILSQFKEKGIQVSAGRICPGFVGISISYQSCVQHTEDLGIVKYYFPLEWENQLIVALREGNAEAARNICETLHRENAQRIERGDFGEDGMRTLQQIIFHDLWRVGKEKGIGEVVLVGDVDWQRIDELVSSIAEQVRSDNTQERETGSELIGYIEAHLSDADLSLTGLEEHFQVSSSTINKRIKEEAGVTFLAYLTRRRIDLAKELLREGRSIAEVTQLCGYESEYSFRRVFHRVVGVRAQNYPVDPKP